MQPDLRSVLDPRRETALPQPLNPYQETDMSVHKIRSIIIRTISVMSMIAMAVAVAAPAFPTGTFKAGDISIQFDDHGHVKVSEGDHTLVDGRFVANADQIKLTDESGPMACPKDEATGSYRWKYEGEALSFSSLDDRCDGRSGDLSGRQWKKEK
jgi:hypothetical protein